MFKNYYNHSIRTLVIAFGNLFNEIYVQKTRENNEIDRLRVPLTYAPKSKFYRRLREPSSISDTVKNEITLPRMSFSIESIQYDPSRKLNKNNIKIVRDSSGKDYSVSRVVPYLFTFDFSTFTKKIDDNFQIMEQVLPYFSPELILKIKFNEVYESVDVPITLDKLVSTEDYDGTMEERRIIITSYSFSVKSYIYGPIDEPTIIETADINNIEFFKETWGKLWVWKK